MNQIYKKNEYVVIPAESNFIVINTEKVFKEGHTHIRELKVARLLIDLAIDKKLPKNPCFADRLIRITSDEKYIRKLKEFKEDAYLNHIDFKRLMEDAPVYKRQHGAMKRVR